ncbi:ubiquinone anaerobic biosynthesis protein UbiV [Peristeroidobacter agariperforans]|uniref:ubiquinone anaerobic biosynthesis protein UbiV n=1 Tax=Peristeroidobacter agariperforans TaxID=268404 RepID=UPI0018E58817|nr:U32 family peptidase [Peristeroidobacter agariperforans]
MLKLSVGPILYLWERGAVLRFYESLCEAPVDIVYLGEVVCSKRRLLQKEEWQSVAGMLRSAGKQVVISTLALIEAESELATLARIAESADTLVEANDYACVEYLAGHPFVAGPHLNVYNEATLNLLARHGAQRWVAPVELPLAIVAALAELRPPNLQVEMFAYGRLPLAFSARCFTARSQRRAKDDCEFICAAHPDGTTVYTRDGQPFLTLNGIQTQSAATQNLLPHLPKLRNAGVDVLRLSPQSRDFPEIVQAFRAAVLGDSSATLPSSFLPGGYCDGYLDGAAGIAHAANERPTLPASRALPAAAAASS